MTVLPPNATIGIIGGGQLGRMSALAAARLGYRCHILTPEADSPAGQVSYATTLGDYEDPAALRAFAGAVDVITFEFENVSAAGLDLLASMKPVHPSPTILRVSQDRVAEKSFLADAGVPTAPWREVSSLHDLEAAVAALGLPAVGGARGLLDAAEAGDDLILDIGPETAARLAEQLKAAGTIVWNGPVGVFEWPAFAHGTETVARAIAASLAYSLAGGGDTLAAIAQFGIENDIDYISTGGGAFLEMLEGKTLPAIEILERRYAESQHTSPPGRPERESGARSTEAFQ